MLPQILSNAPRCKAGDGEILLMPSLQGRIFASLNGQLLHRLDVPLATNPGPDFNNLGGNSQWPAPEGGDFAFNYPADGGPWRVQDGINRAVSQLLPDGKFGMTRTVGLVNKKDVTGQIEMRREITIPNYGFGKKYGVSEVVYATRESLTPVVPMDTNQFVIAAWTLEQFDLTPQTWGFATAPHGKKDVNSDYYGNPHPYLHEIPGGVAFRFNGAPDRLQIGFDEAALPGVVGAVVPDRHTVIVRRITDVLPGKRFNMADNEQPNGVYSAQDAYSIFYGAELNFFEVEAIAPMVQDAQGRVTGSAMTVETHIYVGDDMALARLVKDEFGIDLKG